MASIALASADAALLSEVTRGLSSAHEIHWLSLADALARCERRQIDALIVDLEGGRADIDGLRDFVLRQCVPVIVVGRAGRADAVARSLGAVFFERPGAGERPRSGSLPETVWSVVLLDAMRTCRRRDALPASGRAPVGSQVPGKILVVDDDDEIRLMLRDLLEQEGYSVDVASGGREALELLRSGALPGLILLDLMMPEVNGWEVREALRADPTLSRVPVAVISAVQPPAKAVGDWYLKKPIDLDELLRVIDGFLAAS